MKARGYLTLTVAGIVLLGADLVERTVLVWLLRLRPSSRDRILTRWSHGLARMTIAIVKGFGGANITDLPTLASGPGVLILMNHQSLFDIPLIIKCLEGGYPLIVTRRRYLTGKPLISHMLRLYEFPIVDPGAPIGPQTEALEAVAKETRHPLVVYPEGTRTRDGEIGPFKTGALRAILGTRSWSVHLVVVDGFWRSARFGDFAANVGRIRGRATLLGPFPSPAPGEDPEPFLSELRSRMCARLVAMRAADPDLPPSASLRSTVAAVSTPGTLSGEARSLVDALARVAPSSLRAVLLFGSRLLETAPDEHSAYDLLVVVDDLDGFYRGLRASGGLRHPPWFVAALNRILPPNVVSFQPAPPRGPVAKCFVLTRRDFRRAVSGRAPDHFVMGRLSQRVAVAWTRDEEARDEIVGGLSTVLRRSLDWAGPLVAAPFTVEGFCREMLEISYAGEIRPEAAGRATAVAEAQLDFLREAYGRVFQEAVEAGRLVRGGDGHVFALASGPGRRAELRRYFIRSKARATLRWLKYVFTFDDWLDYIARKAERRTGHVIELTPLERKLPLLLLWPKALRVLRSRSGAKTPGGADAPAPRAGSAR